MLVMFVDIMPILGVGSVLIPWAVYLFIVGDSYTGFGLMLLFIVITVARRVIEPKVIGDSVGIGALSALVSMYVGFKLVGVIGVFIGPLVVIIYSAVRKAGLFQIKIKF
jgi:predicted PurR-regulated permease PerM